jgi:hypothetical protein
LTVSDGSSANAQLVNGQQLSLICAAGMAVIQASISDSASGATTPVTSASFALSGSGCSP